MKIIAEGKDLEGFRPQQGLSIMNYKWLNTEEADFRFPSPTGVKYYELFMELVRSLVLEGFRPQQGLSIMNYSNITSELKDVTRRFPSPTGVKYYESLPTKP